MNGTLVLVGTPIGHPDDISARAIETLRNVGFIACEETTVARRLLTRLGITTDIIEVNEHTEAATTAEVLAVLRAGVTVALISDSGMPVFADPGKFLVSAVLDAGITVDVVPGPDALTAALAVSGFDVHRFLFYGFLSPKRSQRKAELAVLRKSEYPVVFLDTPYRLVQVLEDMLSQLGPDRRACVACDLTLSSQLLVRGKLEELYLRFAADKVKREFVIIIGPRSETHFSGTMHIPFHRRKNYRKK